MHATIGPIQCRFLKGALHSFGQGKGVCQLPCLHARFADLLARGAVKKRASSYYDIVAAYRQTARIKEDKRSWLGERLLIRDVTVLALDGLGVLLRLVRAPVSPTKTSELSGLAKFATRVRSVKMARMPDPGPGWWRVACCMDFWNAQLTFSCVRAKNGGFDSVGALAPQNTEEEWR